MNRTTLRMLCVAGFALFAASCSQGQPAATTGGSTPEGGASLTGGTIGSSGGTIASSGGTTTIASGGSPQTGGNAVTGGSPLAGGSPVTGGVASSGGTARTGGTVGSSGGTISSSGGTISSSGGTATGSGGTTTSSGGVTSTSTGGTARTGGTTASTGGTTSTGGTVRTGGTTTSTGGTTASTGGTTTSTGGTTGSTTVDPATIVPQMDGFLWVATCSTGEVGAGSLDCYIYPEGSTVCPNATSSTYSNKGVIKTITQTVGGTPGTQYTINFELRGVLGSKCYSGGTRRAGDAPPAGWDAESNTDGWYMGGTPSTGLWNTYEIHVTPPVLTETKSLSADKTENVYYLNSMPSTLGVTWCEVHETFPMQYTASFPVFGGGTIKYVLHDSNCKGQQNCGGPRPVNCTTTHRTVDITGMAPPTNPPSAQPYRDATAHYPQWALFDVKSVTSP